MTCHPDLKHIPIKLHEDIPNLYRVMVKKRISGKNSTKGNNLETKKGQTIILVRNHCPVLIHVPIKLHEDIPNHYRVMAYTRMFRKKIIKGA